MAITFFGGAFQLTSGSGAAIISRLQFHVLRDADFQFGLLPLPSPVLGQSSLISFPPLTDMLKFSG